MPDWSYRTVFRSPLFLLGPNRGRTVALGFMGTLARLPLGRKVIQWMGHMNPDKRLTVHRGGLVFPTAVGLGCHLDPRMLATGALAEFGFGYLEIGPIVTGPSAPPGSVHFDAAAERVQIDPPHPTLSLLEVMDRLRCAGSFSMPVLARICPRDEFEAAELMGTLAPHVDAFVVPARNLTVVLQAKEHAIVSAIGERPVIGAIDLESWQNPSTQKLCQQGWIRGILIDSAVSAHDRPLQFGHACLAEGLATLRQIRSDLGPEVMVIGAAGIHCPADALDCIEAGADLVGVDTGLAFAGPGLPKRINEACLYRHLKSRPPAKPDASAVGNQAWFWAALMGASMLIGGLLAMFVAVTRVVLPYVESMSGLTRQQLTAINERLLPFMTHDRVTLAGTMLAVGVLYVTLAWHGIRQGLHWACVTVTCSAMAGFLCFFTFLGFGYFDPFHAFVTSILFQFLLLIFHCPLPVRNQMEMPDLWNDGRWQANQWGQLLFVIHGVALIVAGLVITGIGMTSVFVPEDLEFLCASTEQLTGAHPGLVPLVAHDRATFGGMLISCGMATLLPALWGFRRGQAWWWWALMIAGNVAYVSTMLVHWRVGYTSLVHLLPVYGGLLALWSGGMASFWYLVAPDPLLQAEWRRRLTGLK